MLRVNFFSIIFILTINFVVNSSDENQKINNVQNSNVLAVTGHVKDIQNIIVGYLDDKWTESRILGSHSRASKLVFSQDGTRLASLANGLIKIWDIESSKCIKEINDGQDSATGTENIFSISSFSQDGKYIASNLYNGSIKIWDVSSGECAKEFTANEKFTARFYFTDDLLYSKNEKSIISCSNDVFLKDKALQILDLPSGQNVQNILFDKYINSIVESQNGQYLAVSFLSGEISLYKLNTDEIESVGGLFPIPLPVKKIISQYGSERAFYKKLATQNKASSMSFSNDNKYLAISDVISINIFNTVTGDFIKELRNKISSNYIKFIDNNYLLAGFKDDSIKILDMNSGNTISKIDPFGENAGGITIGYDPTFKYIAVCRDHGYHDARIKLFSNPVHFLSNQNEN